MMGETLEKLNQTNSQFIFFWACSLGKSNFLLQKYYK